MLLNRSKYAASKGLIRLSINILLLVLDDGNWACTSSLAVSVVPDIPSKPFGTNFNDCDPESFEC